MKFHDLYKENSIELTFGLSLFRSKVLLLFCAGSFFADTVEIVKITLRRTEVFRSSRNVNTLIRPAMVAGLVLV